MRTIDDDVQKIKKVDKNFMNAAGNSILNWLNETYENDEFQLFGVQSSIIFRNSKSYIVISKVDKRKGFLGQIRDYDPVVELKSFSDYPSFIKWEASLKKDADKSLEYHVGQAMAEFSTAVSNSFPELNINRSCYINRDIKKN